MGRHSKSGKQKTKNRAKKKRATPAVPPKTSAVSSSSLYGVLDVASDADVETIRQQYVHLIRQFPPETHPDRFQIIRAAYDVLKDPESRRQYDRERFYGNSLDNLRAQVDKLLAKGRGQDALRLLHQIVDIKPSADDYMLMVEGYRAFGQMQDANDAYLKAMALVDDAEDKVRLGMRGAHLSIGDDDDDDDQRIIDALLQLADQYPKIAPPLIASDLFHHYLNLGQIKPGMAYFRRLIPRKKYLTARDFAIYMEWLNVLHQEECYFEFNHLLESKVKPAAKKAAEGPHRDEIKAMLVQRTHVDDESIDWKLKTIIANLAYLADPADKNVRKLWREYADKHLLRLQIEDLITDLRIPTTIVHQILDGLYGKHRVKYGDAMAESLKTRPRIDETLSEATAIDFMAETYPRVYRAFKSQLLSGQSRMRG